MKFRRVRDNTDVTDFAILKDKPMLGGMAFQLSY